MASIITSGASIIAPTAVVGYKSSRTSGNRVHRIVNRASPDVTLRVASMRVGRLEIAFTNATAEADSAAAETVLASAAVFSLVSDRGSVQMVFSLAEGGDLSRTYRDTGAWTISFNWVEVEQ